MGLSDAFNIFLSQSVMGKGIPFDIKIPNDDTAKGIQKAKLNPTNTAKLFLYITLLLNKDELPSEAKDHMLTGNYKDTNEFHISGDLLVSKYLNKL